MEDIIELARNLGAAIQCDESYIKMRASEQNCEEDTKLQALLEDYNTSRLRINIEASKTDRDDTKMQALNKVMRGLYAQITSNENMKTYNAAKREFDEKLERVLGIINNSALGDDPETTDPLMRAGGCSGNCASCGGC